MDAEIGKCPHFCAAWDDEVDEYFCFDCKEHLKSVLCVNPYCNIKEPHGHSTSS